MPPIGSGSPLIKTNIEAKNNAIDTNSTIMRFMHAYMHATNNLIGFTILLHDSTCVGVWRQELLGRRRRSSVTGCW